MGFLSFIHGLSIDERVHIVISVIGFTSLLESQVTTYLPTFLTPYIHMLSYNNKSEFLLLIR